MVPICQEPLCIQDPDGNAIEIIDYHGPGEAAAPDYQGRKRRNDAEGPICPTGGRVLLRPGVVAKSL